MLRADINICGSASASHNAMLHFANFLQTWKDSHLLGYGNGTACLDLLSFPRLIQIQSFEHVVLVNRKKINIVKLCRKLLSYSSSPRQRKNKGFSTMKAEGGGGGKEASVGLWSYDSLQIDA